MPTAPLPAPQAQGHGISALYHRLRQQLLKEVLRHRQGSAHPGLVGDAHQMHRRTCQRQMGALRQAYRRTTEAAAWQAYAQSQSPTPPRRTT